MLNCTGFDDKQTDTYSHNVNNYMLSCLDAFVFSSPLNHHRLTAPFVSILFLAHCLRIFYLYLKSQPTPSQANCLFPSLTQNKLNTSKPVFPLDLIICTTHWNTMVISKYYCFPWKKPCGLHLNILRDSHSTLPIADSQ